MISINDDERPLKLIRYEIETAVQNKSPSTEDFQSVRHRLHRRAARLNQPGRRKHIHGVIRWTAVLGEHSRAECYILIETDELYNTIIVRCLKRNYRPADGYLEPRDLRYIDNQFEAFSQQWIVNYNDNDVRLFLKIFSVQQLFVSNERQNQRKL